MNCWGKTGIRREKIFILFFKILRLNIRKREKRENLKDDSNQMNERFSFSFDFILFHSQIEVFRREKGKFSRVRLQGGEMLFFQIGIFR